MPIDISRALEIEGWMEKDELLWLAEEASKHELIIEIGSYLGRSTRALADNVASSVQGGHRGMVVAIDDWYGPRAEGDKKPDGNPFKEEDRFGLYEKFTIALGDHIHNRVVIPLKMDYSAITEHTIGVVPDMVFIDGDHRYDAVYRDIDFWKRRIRKGGLLCGHDSNYGHVADAVAAHKLDVYYPARTCIWASQC